MGLKELKGKKKFIVIMSADGSVLDIITKDENLQTETGQPVMISADNLDDLKEAGFSEYASDEEIQSDKDEQAENVRLKNGKTKTIRQRNPRALAAIERHKHTKDGKIRIQKAE